MNESTLLLGRLGALLLLTAVMGAACSTFSAEGSLRVALRERTSRLQRELRFLRSALSASRLLGAQVGGLGVALAWGLLGGWLGAAALALAVVLGPEVWLRRAKLRRIRRIEEQLEGWVTAVANALESTPSLGEALRASETLVDRPLRDEVAQILSEIQLGSPLARALQAAADRVGSRALSSVLLTLRIGRNTGGSLPEILHVTAASLREMARLEGVLRTKTAEAKAQAAVISAVPLPLYFGIRALSPGFFDPLETTTLGHVLVAGATVLWVTAALLARRFLAVDL